VDDCWGGGSVVVAVTVAVEVDVTVVVPVTIVINCVGALLILIVIPRRWQCLARGYYQNVKNLF